MTTACAGLFRCAAFLGMAVLAGCGKSEPPPAAEQKSSLDPALAVHPSYKTPEGWRTECVGRQLVDVPAEMEWALANPEDLSLNGAVISDRLKGINDVLGHDGMSLGVSPVVDEEAWKAVIRGEQAEARGFVNGIKRDIESAKRLSKQAADEGDAADSQNWKNKIAQEEALIASFRELDLGVPDSYIRTNGSDVRAYLWRNKRAYRFVIGGRPETLEQTIAHVRDYLSRFRTRALCEIPSGPGVCYPYAFVADNGKRWFDIKNSSRLTDAKGVVYAVRIGRNGKNADMGAVETLLMGAPFMQWAVPRTAGAKKLGLQDADIGPYPVWISGVVMPNRDNPADGDYYRVVSAFMGEENSNQLPFARFEMNG